MKTLTDQLSQYATYHRDRRNIATHLVGVPMIVLGVTTLLARPMCSVADVRVSLASVAALGAVVFYCAMDVRLGALMAALFAAAVWVGAQCGAHSTAVWLGAGIGLFAVGWVVQFVGHYFEGKKPAFVDDLVGLLIGPLFVTTEVVFALGLRKALHVDIIARAGPTRATTVKTSALTS